MDMDAIVGFIPRSNDHCPARCGYSQGRQSHLVIFGAIVRAEVPPQAEINDEGFWPGFLGNVLRPQDNIRSVERGLDDDQVGLGSDADKGISPMTVAGLRAVTCGDTSDMRTVTVFIY